MLGTSGAALTVGTPHVPPTRLIAFCQAAGWRSVSITAETVGSSAVDLRVRAMLGFVLTTTASIYVIWARTIIVVVLRRNRVVVGRITAVFTAASPTAVPVFCVLRATKAHWAGPTTNGATMPLGLL